MQDLPAKVVREGGTVMEFDEPRYAYKQLSDECVCRLIVPSGARVVYPVSSGSWKNEHLRVESAIVDEIQGEETIVENAMESGFFYEEGECVEPDEFSADVEQVSASGIHVFAREHGARHW